MHGTSNQASEMTFYFCVTFPREKKKGKRLESYFFKQNWLIGSYPGEVMQF